VKIARRLTRLEARTVPPRDTYQIVIFDVATGEPLPGHESEPDRPGYIWLPAKNPIPDPYGDDAPCD
jgi:hypothetical protein